MIAIMDWTDGFGNDTEVVAIARDMNEAEQFYQDYHDKKKLNYPEEFDLRYEEFDFGDVDFCYYEAKKFDIKNKKKKK